MYKYDKYRIKQITVEDNGICDDNKDKIIIDKNRTNFRIVP